ncbi:MAG TPA: 3-hydroxybutyrate dehydrogenase [Castellaniella sp.]|uniref:3-hydroxybutyrate dehydrogenase n=1 Tax=Castellaniella sp. TaxID=1955812 RepID=UPI002EE099DB
MSLKGKVALVTGAASGLGKRIAEVFADAGANIVIADLKLEAAQATADAIAKKGVKTMAVAMDVTDEAAVDAGFDQVQKAMGYVDIAVSNAGIQIVAPIQDFKFSDWKKLLAVHLDGGFLTSRAAVRHMIASKRGGCILFMGSVHSKEASKLKSPYVTAKHGLEGLAKVISKEGAQYGIRTNVICPGFVRTPLVEKQIPEQAQELGITEEQVIKTVMLKDTVDGEFTTVDDVAQVALTFAAFPSNALTGQSLVVSHGWFMQ